MTGDKGPSGEAAVADRDAESGAAMPLVLSRWMQVEQIDAAAATIYHQASGARLRIPRSLYDVLLGFEQPRTVLSVAGSPERAGRMAGAIANLRHKGFLIGADEPEPAFASRLTTDPPVRLFDCPPQKQGSARTDIVALGVPYDFGARCSAGSRHGPTSLRETSMEALYGVDRRTGRPQGWFDADRGCPILEGISIADGGDILVHYGEPQADSFGRIREVLSALTADGALPVLIGGDSTISFSAIDLLQSKRPLAVIRVGCNPTPSEPTDATSFINVPALPARALALPGVKRYVHVGESGLSERAAAALAPGLVRVSLAQVGQDGLLALREHLVPGQHVYLGLDMSALDLPGDDVSGSRERRLDYATMHSLICGIGSTYPILGIDLVGLNPSKPCSRVGSTMALHVLLTALSAAKDPS